MVQKKWQPIATQKQIALISESLPKIIEPVVSEIDEKDLSLTGGICGKLIFLYEARKQTPSLVANETLENITQILFKNTASFPFDHSIARGLSGLGWTLDHLGFSDDEDFNSDINECLLEIISVPVWKGEYELLYGLSGIGTYGVCRVDKPCGEEIARRVLQHLIALSSESPDGIYWETRSDSYFFNDTMPSPQKNLGTAHGNCAVMGFLIKLVENNVALEVSKPLLRELCRWFISQKLDPETANGGYFPGFVGNNKTSRMGWCYGDLTTSLLLLRAGLALDNESIYSFGNEVAKLSTQRNVENGSVFDGALCHGSGGISVIYQHIAQYTDTPEVTEAAQRWLQVTLDKAEQSQDLSGLLQSKDRLPENVRSMYKHGDFLTGYAGVGLSLLSATSNEPVSWGSSLLLS